MQKNQLIFHKSRRDKLLQQTGKGSVILILGNTLRNRSYDQNYYFSQDRNFYYLTGFEEPDSALLLFSEPFVVEDKLSKKKYKTKEVLFVQPKNPEREIWVGKRLGKDLVKKELGISASLENNELPRVIDDVITKGGLKFYINFYSLFSLDGELKKLLTPFIHNLKDFSPNHQIIDVSHLIGRLRKVKTEYEIAQIRRAVDITVKAYKESIRIVKPGIYEYEIQSILENNYRKKGAGNAFYPIIASGNNACTLHYEINKDKLRNNDLLLIDSGAEYNYYNADITRTVPVNGTFNSEQKIIYDIVLRANKECIKKIKPGVKLTYLKKFTREFLAKELIRLGLIKNQKDVIKYYMHSVGHHLGLDTHDAVPLVESSYGDNDSLKPGNVITIEPGLYLPETDRNLPLKFRRIGVRIEDDVLVTNIGYEILTSSLTKETKEIQSMMKGIK